MTLIDGVKCQDGFVVAADTAVSMGHSGVHHGEKLHCYRGSRDQKYKIVIACAGDLSYAGMTCQDIRDAVATLSDFNITSIKGAIKSVLLDIYSKYMTHYWLSKHDDPPDFCLIIAVEASTGFQVFVTKDMAVLEVDTYEFRGTGYVLAEYLGERFLQSSPGSILQCPVATAVHLIAEIFRAVKESDAFVGRDTQIIAWRSTESTATYATPISLEIVGIQENLKRSLWAALERHSLPDKMFEHYVKNIGDTLTAIKNHTQSQDARELRFIRYSLSPSTNVWSMGDLEPAMPPT